MILDYTTMALKTLIVQRPGGVLATCRPAQKEEYWSLTINSIAWISLYRIQESLLLAVMVEVWIPTQMHLLRARPVLIDRPLREGDVERQNYIRDRHEHQ